MPGEEYGIEEAQAASHGGWEPAGTGGRAGRGHGLAQPVIRKRDGRIAELEAQVAEAAKSAETADALRNEIAELKAQGESDRIEFELRLTGVRNVKAAEAILADHGGDVAVLREAEPWLFSDVAAVSQKVGTIGLPTAGTSTDNMKCAAAHFMLSVSTWSGTPGAAKAWSIPMNRHSCRALGKNST